LHRSRDPATHGREALARGEAEIRCNRSATDCVRIKVIGPLPPSECEVFSAGFFVGERAPRGACWSGSYHQRARRSTRKGEPGFNHFS